MPLKTISFFSFDNYFLISRCIRLVILPVINIRIFNFLKHNHIKIQHQIRHFSQIEKLDIHIVDNNWI